MPTPKDGTPGSLVTPATPDEAHDADDANPGEVEKLKLGNATKPGTKYNKQDVKPIKPPDPSDPQPDNPVDPVTKPSWIEILLVDANDNPVAGEPYKVTAPDNSEKEGTLDDKGFARIDNIDPGSCKVTFPALDGRSWKKV
jgi:hypothetical protein